MRHQLCYHWNNAAESMLCTIGMPECIRTAAAWSFPTTLGGMSASTLQHTAVHPVLLLAVSVSSVHVLLQLQPRRHGAADWQQAGAAS
jgi:hypothetical protein